MQIILYRVCSEDQSKSRMSRDRCVFLYSANKYNVQHAAFCLLVNLCFVMNECAKLLWQLQRQRISWHWHLEFDLKFVFFILFRQQYYSSFLYLSYYNAIQCCYIVKLLLSDHLSVCLFVQKQFKDRIHLLNYLFLLWNISIWL